jgi:zinc protease
MMSLRTLELSLVSLALLACPRQTPEITPEPPASEETSAWRNTPPEPLEARPFVLPEPVEGSLSNGIPIVVVENHEVPLVYVRLTLDVGGYMDPSDLAGLASVTMDMLNEGAGEWSAAELSTELRRMGSSLGSSAGNDGAQVGITCLKSQLEPTLDLMASVALHPNFPDADWDLMRSKRIQDLKASRKNPRQMNARAWSHLMYGDRYLGQLSNEAAYEGMSTELMADWHQRNLQPFNAILLVGGDTTLAKIQPLLEARFGSWGSGAESLNANGLNPALPQVSDLPEHEGSTIFLVDSPGAAQSVIKVGTFVSSRLDQDYAAFTLANHVIGGQFSARINLNLREDKGWTYGARSRTWHNHLPGLWSVGTSVVTEHTADAVVEILAELSASLGDRPISADELERSKDGILGTRPLSFEQPGYLLDQTRDVVRYGLPSDWISTYEDRFRSVDLEQAQAAWANHINPDALTWVIVGDLEIIRPQLEELMVAMVEIDANGIPLP